MKRRVTIGFAMGVIFVIAVALAAVDRVRRDGERERCVHDQLRLQEGATGPILTKARLDLLPPDRKTQTSSMGVGSSYMHWRTTVREVTDDGGQIDLELNGQITGRDLKPIRVLDKGGKLNGEIIKRLTAEYAKRKWAYVIEHAE